ncbi:hypothetical protein D9619_011696 [Psilocybe cf. subviscida]|uniref:Carboxymuconolactone decarboxylase-like domain-containing protein n=1 Tax=Psilocybe cf. subviscida TaxID=2480587 RepID=A0A8H5BUN6_9AGAR|nr:hypothetical protein D9619_011696 [Psilocybe cf. subviscida]
MSDKQNAAAHKELYDAGLVVRREVMGNAYVDNQLARGTSEFMEPMQELATSAAWGTIWTRPGLERKQRSLIVIALLAAQGKEAELTGHIRGAVNNGATEIEIRETLLQTATYSGIPTGMWAFRVGDATIKQLKQEKLLPS